MVDKLVLQFTLYLRNNEIKDAEIVNTPNGSNCMVVIIYLSDVFHDTYTIDFAIYGHLRRIDT